MQRQVSSRKCNALRPTFRIERERNLNGDRERKVLNGHERKGERRLARRAPFIEIWNQWSELRNGSAVHIHQNAVEYREIRAYGEM